MSTKIRLHAGDITDFIRNLTGVTSGAEIGVLEGATTERFHRLNSLKHMFLVDPWYYDPEWNDIANLSQPVQDLRYQLVRAKFPNDTVFRMTSKDAARRVADASLDFVYIDARHDEASIAEDIQLWYPKVKPNGKLTGHDYDLGHTDIVNVVSKFAYSLGKDIDIYQGSSVWCIYQQSPYV